MVNRLITWSLAFEDRQTLPRVLRVVHSVMCDKPDRLQPFIADRKYTMHANTQVHTLHLQRFYCLSTRTNVYKHTCRHAGSGRSDALCNHWLRCCATVISVPLIKHLWASISPSLSGYACHVLTCAVSGHMSGEFLLYHHRILFGTLQRALY